MAFKISKLINCLTILQFLAVPAWAQSLKDGQPVLLSPQVQKQASEIFLQRPKAKADLLGLENVKIDLILDLEALKKSGMPEGPRTGGGGNGCALVTQTATNKLIELVSLELLKETITESEQQLLLEVMQKARFYTADKLILKGERKDAINYPARSTIVLDSYFCDYKLSELSGQSLSLLLHEYLGLAHIDDTKYQVSQIFIEAFRKKNYEDNRYKLMALNELKKDEAGQKSCFKGQVLKAKNKLIDEDGRIAYDMEFNYDLVEIYSEDPRHSSEKYASFYDKKGKPADYADGVIGKNSFDSTRIFLVAAKYTSATTGSFYETTKAFKIQIDEKIKTEFKVDFNNEYGIKDEKLSAPIYSFKCQTWSGIEP